MVQETLSLRLSCKSNHVWGRFPIPTVLLSGIEEEKQLEIYLIESFIAYRSSCYVPTNVIWLVSNMVLSLTL